MRVPLVLWGPPDLPRGVRVGAPVQSVDVAPTILTWLGREPLPGGDGVPLLPPPPADAPGTRAIYGESIDLHLVFDVPALRFVREGPWKYLHKPAPELYHVLDDPGETHNAIAAQPERAERLRERLAALLSTTEGDPGSPPVAVDPETARQLESLGYVASGAGRAGDDLDSLALAGSDPHTLKEAVRAYNSARNVLHYGDPERGTEMLAELAPRHPESSPILESLLDAQLRLGRAEAALATLRRGVEIDPDYHRYWSNLGELLVKMGRREEATAVLRETVERWPCDAASRGVLVGLASERAARIALLEEGLEACEATPELENDLAFLLAASPEPALRDGARAVALAERAAAALGDHPLVLDTVAAAYAESGRFDEARRTARRALDLAARQGLPEEAMRVLREHLALLERGEPIRE